LYNFLLLKQNVYEFHKYDMKLWRLLMITYETKNEFLKKIAIEML